MKYLIILFTLVSFGSFGAGTESSTSEITSDASDQITKLYELAEKHIYTEKYDKSLKLLKKLTKREDLGTKRADIYNLLGFSYRKIENPDLDKSFAAYMMALELEPDHVGAHEYLGELYLMRGNTEKASSMLVKLEMLVGTDAQEYKDLLNVIENY
ncbi:tetratricopeptide repeat protein [Alphaproteobacteria bacterium]|nr:tetratricopeptide repeat protein [Alphaproteobacteria bacterium]